MKGQSGFSLKILSAIVVMGTFVLVSAGPTEAHTVPACCIGPFPPPNGSGTVALPADCPNPPTQAPKSKGGDTVRVQNKHCGLHETPGDPNR